MKLLTVLFFAWIQSLIAVDLPLLYDKNLVAPAAAHEISLVEHTRTSLENALHFYSKLNGSSFGSDRKINILPSDSPSDHLLNNLCTLPSASHLHIGLLRGGSFVAALYGNEDILHLKIGMDWFQEFPEEQFRTNCMPYLQLDRCQIINSGCFDFDISTLSAPIDIYFYDADHSLIGHQKAFTYYNDCFADVFIAVVDDWSCPWVRKPTFRAFDKLGYSILYQATIPSSPKFGNGQYVAVIKKPSTK